MYQISNTGVIKSLPRYVKRCDGIVQFKRGVVKAPKINSDGYYTTTLSKNGKNKTIGIHILVARHFIPNPDNLPEVNHIDFNRKNNCVENLEWSTHQVNIRHSADAGRYKLRDFNGSNNPNYGNHILSDIYRADPELAKEKLARPGSQNGRSVKIELYDSEFNFIASFDWIGGCANYLIEKGYTTAAIDSIRSNITSSIKNNRKYLNHYYKTA